MLTMESLETCFRDAKVLGKRFVAVSVKLPNANSNEIHINGKENFDEKLTYYHDEYDENLNHKFVQGLKIENIVCGNTFDNIQYQLNKLIKVQ